MVGGAGHHPADVGHVHRLGGVRPLAADVDRHAPLVRGVVPATIVVVREREIRSLRVGDPNPDALADLVEDDLVDQVLQVRREEHLVRGPVLEREPLEVLVAVAALRVVADRAARAGDQQAVAAGDRGRDDGIRRRLGSAHDPRRLVGPPVDRLGREVPPGRGARAAPVDIDPHPHLTAGALEGLAQPGMVRLVELDQHGAARWHPVARVHVGALARVEERLLLEQVHDPRYQLIDRLDRSKVRVARLGIALQPLAVGHRGRVAGGAAQARERGKRHRTADRRGPAQERAPRVHTAPSDRCKWFQSRTAYRRHARPRCASPSPKGPLACPPDRGVGTPRTGRRAAQRPIKALRARGHWKRQPLARCGQSP